ncbi:MAG: hypothetical protein ACK4YU_01050 [Paracoccus sp. (in: a-proteobacteria)]
MTTDKKPDAASPEPDRRNGQGEHAGVAHAPEEFDSMNPAKIKKPAPTDQGSAKP